MVVVCPTDGASQLLYHLQLFIEELTFPVVVVDQPAVYEMMNWYRVSELVAFLSVVHQLRVCRSIVHVEIFFGSFQSVIAAITRATKQICLRAQYKGTESVCPSKTSVCVYLSPSWSGPVIDWMHRMDSETDTAKSTFRGSRLLKDFSTISELIAFFDLE